MQRLALSCHECLREALGFTAFVVRFEAFLNSFAINLDERPGLESDFDALPSG